MPLEEKKVTESAYERRYRENKPTEDSVNPNDIREERRPKRNEHSHSHEEHSRSTFD